MSLVATDGHHVWRSSASNATATRWTETEIKGDFAEEDARRRLARLLTEGDGDISYERGENHLFFDVGGRMLISRIIDGQFPAYERVIPKGNDKHIEFERDRLTNAVRRVALLSNERSRAVKVQLDKGKVDVSSSSPELGEAKETLPVEYSGAPMQICFNAQYVLDFLAAVTTDVVALELKDEVSQAVMTPVGADGYDYTYVIMPMPSLKHGDGQGAAANPGAAGPPSEREREPFSQRTEGWGPDASEWCGPVSNRTKWNIPRKHTISIRRRRRPPRCQPAATVMGPRRTSGDYSGGQNQSSRGPGGSPPAARDATSARPGPAGLHHLVYEVVDNSRSTKPWPGSAIRSTSRFTSTAR